MDLLCEIEGRGANAGDPRLDDEIVIQTGGGAVIGGAVTHDEHEPGLMAQPLLLEAGDAQQLGARPLGVFEVIGVVNKPRGVRILIIDSDGEEMCTVVDHAGPRQVGSHDAASSLSLEASKSNCALGGRSGVRPRYR